MFEQAWEKRGIDGWLGLVIVVLSLAGRNDNGQLEEGVEPRQKQKSKTLDIYSNCI